MTLLIVWKKQIIRYKIIVRTFVVLLIAAAAFVTYEAMPGKIFKVNATPVKVEKCNGVETIF